jgi:hypothetical protein
VLAVANKAVDEGYNVFFSTMDVFMHILKTQEISVKTHFLFSQMPLTHRAQGLEVFLDFKCSQTIDCL